MTDPRIEAAAKELKRLFSESDTATESMWVACAETVLAAADAAARARVVPFPIPDNRMETAKNTLLCWKGGALSDDDAIGMIVCGVSEPPASIDALGGVEQ
ncbi:hypothetical protein [Acetobacter sp. P5B1]|uniref:hypothetical protein n=1 Tax=Acetobacter sp. P5B1 TaxID=2762620 RepID=UPI001C054B84|nr:hypothetical protein [Acetobacter sp. P5B1]